MTRQEYKDIEFYMLECMKDSAHDKYHIYRVLNAAVEIARSETGVNQDVIIAASLLHDIGRDAQATGKCTCHAVFGAGMAYHFLIELGWSEADASHVSDCITTHRFRGDRQPATIEAKIIFDADKLDATGLIGIARTLIYAGQTHVPMYVLDDAGQIIPDKSADSFISEYNFKLKNVYDTFYTPRGAELANSRKVDAQNFVDTLTKEISGYAH